MLSFKTQLKNFIQSIQLVILLLGTCYFSFIEEAFSEVLDKIVATVNGEPLSMSEINALKKQLDDESINKNKEEKINDNLKDLITLILFNREASKLGLQVADQDIQEYIRKVEESNGISPGGMEEALKEQGVSLDIYKSKITREITKSRVIAMNVRSKIQVTDSEVLEKMGKTEEIKRDDGKIHLLKFNFTDSNLDKVKTIREEVKNAGTCEANKNTEINCIDLGIVEPKDWKEELAEKIEGLSEDEESDIIKEENGSNSIYFRVKSNFGTAKGQNFEKVKDQIYQEKFLKEAENFLKNDLFEKYQVEIIN